MPSRPPESAATGAAQGAPEPLFIELGAPLPGRRFALLHSPPGDQPPRGLIVQVAALAEEMNKSRRMAALQSRALAAAGYAVLQFDLFGCGDSDGDFADATWQGWIGDVAGAARWLQARCGGSDSGSASGHGAPPLWLWGHRVGALLCAAAARQLEAPCHLLLWQPTASGRTAWQQWLRTKAAGDLGSGQAKATMAAARAAVATGQPVEIAGYAFAAALASGLDAAQFDPPPAAGDNPRQLAWIEVTSDDGALLPASERQLQTWRDAGWSVHSEAVVGPAFWQTTEIEVAPALLPATLAALGAWAASRSQPAAAARAGAPVGDPARPPAGAAGRARAAQGQATRAIAFGCRGETLIGVVHAPPVAEPALGVVVVVGGPQYRVGSHRQFVQLARDLAAAGIAVLRFDVRGMGDSSGAPRSFEALSDDIAAACDALQAAVPTVDRIALWGLCDGASAALLYLDERPDPRIAGVALANPWVRSVATQARTQVKHYYLQRVADPAFWRKLARGAVSPRALGELFGALWRARAPAAPASASFQARMLRGWTARPLPTLLLLSESDYTAREFVETARADAAWARALQSGHVGRHDVAGADHTFSAAASKAAVSERTAAWARALAPRRPVAPLTERAGA